MLSHYVPFLESFVWALPVAALPGTLGHTRLVKRGGGRRGRGGARASTKMVKNNVLDT